MKCTVLGKGTVICGPEVVDQRIVVGDREWRFDFDTRFGPLWLGRGRDAKPLANQNPPAAVWDAFERWHQAYRAKEQA